LFLGEFLDKMAGFSEIMAWKPGKEVMSNLEVQSAMEKFHEWVTNYIGCGAQLAMREGLCWTEISSGSRVVRKDDLGKLVRGGRIIKRANPASYLDMQWTWNHVAHEEVHKTCFPRTAATNDVPIPVEEADKGEHLKPPSPTTTTSLAGVIAGDPEMAIWQTVEVETRERHDNIE
jgi:hypothetical protein